MKPVCWAIRQKPFYNLRVISTHVFAVNNAHALATPFLNKEHRRDCVYRQRRIATHRRARTVEVTHYTVRGPENCRELGYRRVYRVFPTRPQQIASGIRRYVRTYVLFFLSSKTKETCSVMSTACKPDGCHIIIVVYELVCQRHSKRGYSIHTMCVILGAQDLGTLRGV